MKKSWLDRTALNTRRVALAMLNVKCVLSHCVTLLENTKVSEELAVSRLYTTRFHPDERRQQTPQKCFVSLHYPIKYPRNRNLNPMGNFK
jgi:hypothetical protein